MRANTVVHLDSSASRLQFRRRWSSRHFSNPQHDVTFDVTGALALVRDRKQHEPTVALATNAAGIVATASKPGHKRVGIVFSFASDWAGKRR
jgi:hypothetical protein